MKKEKTIIPFDSIKTIHLKENSVTTSKINDGAITTEKILDRSILNHHIEDGVITYRKFADANFVFSKRVSADNIETKKIVLTNENPIEINSKNLIKNLNAEYLNNIKSSTASTPDTIVQRNNLGDIEVKKIISTERFDSPFLISSSSLVKNLNANFLNGMVASNSKDGIPLSNGELNNNLNAELLEGAKLSKNQIVSNNEKLIPNEKIVKDSIEKSFKSFETSDKKDWDEQNKIGVNVVLNGHAPNGPKQLGYFYVFNLLNENNNITQLAIPTDTRLFGGSFIRMKHNNYWSKWFNFTTGDPLTLSSKTTNKVSPSGHTHELSNELLNRNADQEIYGKNIFHNISTSQNIKDPNHIPNKKYVDNKFLINKTLVGLNYEFINPAKLLIKAGECFDSTLTEKITMSYDERKSLNELIFDGVELNPFSTYHIFILKRIDGKSEIRIDDNMFASHKTKEYSFYRRIGSIITDKNYMEPFVKEGNKILLTTPKIINIYKPYKGNIKMYGPHKHISLIETNGECKSLFYDKYITDDNGELYFEFEGEGFIKIYGWEDYLIGE